MALQIKLAKLVEQRQSLRTQLASLDQEIRGVNRVIKREETMDQLNQLLEAARKRPETKFLFHPQPCCVWNTSLEDLFAEESLDPEESTAKESDVKASESEIKESNPDKLAEAKFHEFVSTHFQVEVVTITYRVSTCHNTPLRISEYDGEWEIDYEDFDHKSEYDLTFYKRLYKPGQTDFTEDVGDEDTNEDSENTYGFGYIYPQALALKLKSVS